MRPDAPVTTLPPGLAPLREEAERLARDHWLALGHAIAAQAGRVFIEDGAWEGNDMDNRAVAIEAQIRLLADLSRPASMDWAARTLTTHGGEEQGSVAGAWEMSSDKTGWWLDTGGIGLFFECDLTDPAAAMVACVLAVLDA